MSLADGRQRRPEVAFCEHHARSATTSATARSAATLIVPTVIFVAVLMPDRSTRPP
jgi:hypothetical protein